VAGEKSADQDETGIGMGQPDQGGDWQKVSGKGDVWSLLWLKKLT